MTNATARSQDFLQTLGVNTHVPYTDGGYANTRNIAADLAYLGVNQVRDGISDGQNGSASLSSFISLAQQGVKFTIGVVDGSVHDTASLNARLLLVQRLIQAVPGCVIAVEGANEINNWPVSFNGVGGLQGAVDLQRAIYTAVHGNPVFSGVAVDYFTGYGVGSIGVGPDPSTTAGLADFNTQHPYPSNGGAPSQYTNPANVAPNESNPGAPIVFTETGYSSNGGTWAGVDQTVQAKYTLDLLLDAAKNGVAQTDLYELMDAYATGSPQGNDGYGLFDTANRPKLVATAIHNLTTILADPGPNARTFTLTPFAPTVTGLPATGQTMILEKSSGAADIVIWDEPQIWDAAQGKEMAAASHGVTLDLGTTYAAVSVYDPLAGSSPVTTLTNVRSVQVAITDHPLIIEVARPIVPPRIAITSEALASDTGASRTDGVTSNGAITLSGTVSGSPGTGVIVYDGTVALGAAVRSGVDTWTFATTLGAGVHALRAVATDPTGGSADAATGRLFTVVTAPPTITMGSETLSADGKTERLAGTVSGTAGTIVTVSNGAVPLGVATLDGTGGWTMTTGVTSGRYAFTATATDLAGNSASVDPVVIVPAIVPQPIATASSAAKLDSLVLNVSEDAYKGDAQFSVTVDGQKVGGVQTVTAIRGRGQSQNVTLTGAFGTGVHAIGVTFLNDLYNGTAATDRNLFVNSIALNGTVTATNAAQWSNGLATYKVTAPITSPDMLTLTLAEDAYQGDAQFVVTVDGKAVGGVQTVTAQQRLGQTQDFTLTGYFGTGQRTIGVTFLNDCYRGTASTDRNLYVKAITLDGMTTSVNNAQYCQGLANYTVTAATTAPTPGAALSPVVASGATMILDKDAGAAATVTMKEGSTLQLSDAGQFRGTIAGFGRGDTLDLRSQVFGASSTLTYAGHGATGTLTVSDGTHAATLAMVGQYAASNFTSASDGQGGTAILFRS